MSEGYVRVPRDGAGKKLRTTIATIDDEEVHTEVVQVVDSSNNIINPSSETKQDDILTALASGISIKDEISSDTAQILTYDGQKALAVIPINQAESIPSDTILVFDERDIAGSTTETQASYTVPTGKWFFIDHIIVGGNTDGKFRLKVNGSTYALARSSGTQRTQELFFSKSKTVPTDIVEIETENVDITSGRYEVTLIGFLSNIV